MEKEFSCFFTGHRRISKNKAEWLSRELKTKIRYIIEDKGVTDFITGGALGFDTIAAEAVIALKESEYPEINLHLYLPCHNQMRGWALNEQYKARIIMSKSNTVFVTDGPYTEGCMQKRNRKMADDAQYCIAFCERFKSGTGGTIKYAESIGDYVENIANV